MPFYDLRCTRCEREFNLRASMREKSEKTIPCPHCGSVELETVYKSAPNVIGKAAPECPHSHICGSGCQHAQ